MKFFCTLALWTVLLTACATAPTATSREVYAMDTVMQLTVYGDRATTALDQAEAALLNLENRLSRTRDTSQIAAINQSDGPVAVDGDVAQLLALALEYGAGTAGAFDCTVAPVMDVWGFTTDDPRVPTDLALTAALETMGGDGVLIADNTVTLTPGTAVDLGGIAKGYASQMVGEIFQENAVDHAMVSLGGNVYVCGGKPDGSAWRVGVQDPNNSAEFAGVLSITDGFAVTSGAYQRYFEEEGATYHHIIDPTTGYPADSGLSSVTIVSADDGTLCDALSTALYVMGPEAAVEFWRSGVYTFEMILLTQEGTLLVSQGLEAQFEANGAYDYEVVS